MVRKLFNNETKLIKFGPLREEVLENKLKKAKVLDKLRQENLNHIEELYEQQFNAYMDAYFERLREQERSEEAEKELAAYEDARIKEIDRELEEELIKEYLEESEKNILKPNHDLLPLEAEIRKDYTKKNTVSQTIPLSELLRQLLNNDNKKN